MVRPSTIHIAIFALLLPFRVFVLVRVSVVLFVLPFFVLFCFFVLFFFVFICFLFFFFFHELPTE
jgi:hypothetical protein